MIEKFEREEILEKISLVRNLERESIKKWIKYAGLNIAFLELDDTTEIIRDIFLKSFTETMTSHINNVLMSEVYAKFHPKKHIAAIKWITYNKEEFINRKPNDIIGRLKRNFDAEIKNLDLSNITIDLSFFKDFKLFFEYYSILFNHLIINANPVFNYIVDNLNDVYFLHLNKSLNSNPDFNNIEPVESKIKIKISVPQIVTLFKALMDGKFIEAQAKTHIYKFISQHFSSKSSDNISEASLKNNFESPEKLDYTFWKNIFKER